MNGPVALFVGASGVGKSHVINLLNGDSSATVSRPFQLAEITYLTKVHGRYIDTPGFDGTKYTTFSSDIKPLVDGKDVLVVLVVPRHLTRVTGFAKQLKEVLSHFDKEKLLVVWNSQYGPESISEEQRESLNSEFPRISKGNIHHLNSSLLGFREEFTNFLDGQSFSLRWKPTVTGNRSPVSSKKVTHAVSPALCPRIRLERIVSLSKFNESTELKNAVKKLCQLHDSSREKYDNLKVVGDALVRFVAAKYLIRTQKAPIDGLLRPFTANGGKMLEVFESYVAKHMNTTFHQGWEDHSKVDFIEALIAPDENVTVAMFIFGKMGIGLNLL